MRSPARRSQRSRSSPACRVASSPSAAPRAIERLGEDGVGVASAARPATATPGSVGPREQGPRRRRAARGRPVARARPRAPRRRRAPRRPWRATRANAGAGRRRPRRARPAARAASPRRAAAVPSAHSARPQWSSTVAASVQRPATSRRLWNRPRPSWAKSGEPQVGRRPARRPGATGRGCAGRHDEPAGDVVEAVAVLGPRLGEQGVLEQPDRRAEVGQVVETGAGYIRRPTSGARVQQLGAERDVLRRRPRSTSRPGARPRGPRPPSTGQSRLGEHPSQRRRDRGRVAPGHEDARAAGQQLDRVRERRRHHRLPATTASVRTPEVTWSRRVVGQQHDVGRRARSAAASGRRGSGRRTAPRRPRPRRSTSRSRRWR